MSEEKKPIEVRCTNCGHEWPAIHLPMEFAPMLELMKNVRCPMCAAPPSKIKVKSNMANTTIGVTPK